MLEYKLMGLFVFMCWQMDDEGGFFLGNMKSSLEASRLDELTVDWIIFKCSAAGKTIVKRIPVECTLLCSQETATGLYPVCISNLQVKKSAFRLTSSSINSNAASFFHTG